MQQKPVKKMLKLQNPWKSVLKKENVPLWARYHDFAKKREKKPQAKPAVDDCTRCEDKKEKPVYFKKKPRDFLRPFKNKGGTSRAFDIRKYHLVDWTIQDDTIDLSLLDSKIQEIMTKFREEVTGPYAKRLEEWGERTLSALKNMDPEGVLDETSDTDTETDTDSVLND